MNLPNVPTDNLYKFISIFGLTMLVLSIVIPTYVLQEQTAKSFEYAFQIKEDWIKQKEIILKSPAYRMDSFASHNPQIFKDTLTDSLSLEKKR